MQLLEEQSSIHTQYWKRRKGVNSTPLTHKWKSNFCDWVRGETTSLHLLLLHLVSQKDNQPHHFSGIFTPLFISVCNERQRTPACRKGSRTEPSSFLMRGCPPVLLTFLHALWAVTPHLRTRKAPRRDQSWEMMQRDVSVLPCSSLLPTRLLQLAASPALPKPTQSHHQLLHTRAWAWEVHFSHLRAVPREGSPSPYASPALLSQPSPSRTSSITMKTLAWMLQSVGRQHEESLPTTH